MHSPGQEAMYILVVYGTYGGGMVFKILVAARTSREHYCSYTAVTKVRRLRFVSQFSHLDRR